MAVENPSLHAHHDIIMRESHQLAYRVGGDPEVIDDFALKLLLTVLDAYEVGLPRNEIEAALKAGFHHGELQCADTSLTPDYWQAIRDEVEGTS